MSIITTSSENAPEQIRSAAGPYKAAEKSKWLYELERAQWQERHSRSVAAADTRPAPESAPETLRAKAGTTANPSPDPVAKSPVSPRVVPPPDCTAASRVDTPVLALEAEAAAPQVVAAPYALPAPPQSVPMSAADSAGGMPGLMHAELRRFETQHAHLYEQNGQVQVWLRDPALADRDGLPLLAQLRERFRASGHNLLALTVNGHSILESTQPPKRVTAKE
jgi:hypothetical protein